MPFVVGFGGQYRSGKDTAADYLYERLKNMGQDWKRASLGINVKKIFAEHMGVTLEFIEEWKVKTEIPPGFNGTIRDGLTKIGDGWRDTKNDIWLYKLFNNNSDNIIISDVRYNNEARAIRGEDNWPYMKGYKGVTALIWRPGWENNKPSRSEQELMPYVRTLENQPDGQVDNGQFPDIPFDLWLKNDGNKEDWLKKVDDIVIPYIFDRFSLS